MATVIPRWKSAIAAAISEYEKANVIQIATIDSSDLRVPTPRVRSHIFRAFLSASSTPSLPLIVTTTDIRAPKAFQITSNPHVELAWWIEGLQQQFRISGLASVIPHPKHPLYHHFLDNIKNARKNSGLASLTREDIDWEKKRNDVFKGLSGYMRATWCKPIPGSPLQGGEEEMKQWPVKLEEPTDADAEDSEVRKNWEMALGNFAMLIVDPTEVDYVVLAPPRRTRFWKTDQGSWQEEALVP